jgi:hypothetical protein
VGATRRFTGVRFGEKDIGESRVPDINLHILW